MRHESERTMEKDSSMLKLICKSCTAKCIMTYTPLTGRITGNKCPRGEAYAKDYRPDAVKIRTYQLPVKNGHMKRLAVRTGIPVGEALSDRIETLLKTVTLTAPIEAGATVLTNLGGTGVDLVATRKMPTRRAL